MTDLEWMLRQDANHPDPEFRGLFAAVWKARRRTRATNARAREHLVDMNQDAACEYIRARAAELEKDAEITRLRQALAGVEQVLSDSPTFNARDLGPAPVLRDVRSALGKK